MVHKGSQVALVAALCALTPAFPALANLESVDLATPGDGLVTRDTQSGLDWLDLPLTAGQSVSYWLGNGCNGVPECPPNGWFQDGWRMATTSEVCDLFHQFDLDADPSCPDPVEQGFYPFGHAKLGINVYNALDEPVGIRGVFDDGPPEDRVGSAWMIDANNLLFVGLQIIIEDAVSWSVPVSSLFLVRASPPPPPPPLVPGLLPTSAIFMAALIAIAGRGLTRQRPSRGRGR